MRLLVALFVVVLLVPLVHAGDITLSLNQSDYYFPVGTQSAIGLHAENSYNSTVKGNLGYTITQSINQGGMQYQSSNRKSTTFSIKNGKSTIGLGFGTSDSPLVLSVSMSFTYEDNGTREVDLGDIKIHFVENSSQQQTQQNQVKSSSQKTQASQQQTDPFAQQEKEMQQMLNQMTGNQQQTQQPSESDQQKLQNSQMNQDSSALKKQMQEQVQKEQQMQKNFQRQVAQDPEFQQAHQELMNQGYNLTGASLDPTSNNTGSFKLDYQNKAGQNASLSGQMQNGSMHSIQKDTPETRKQMLELLYNDSRFKKFNKTLYGEGFSLQGADVSFSENMTNVQVNYGDGNNQTAGIRGDIENETVKDVVLIDGNGKVMKSYWWLLIVLAGILVIGYLGYMKFAKKAKTEETEDKKIVKKPFDYKKEARAMLEKAGKLFSEKRYKDAYMTAGQALRLFLNYENGLEKETTNDEIIEHLRKEKKDFKDAKDCFDLCSLVEFAKYKANKKDFDKIMMYAGKVIG